VRRGYGRNQAKGNGLLEPLGGCQRQGRPRRHPGERRSAEQQERQARSFEGSSEEGFA
jgi:hypothetical protein